VADSVHFVGAESRAEAGRVQTEAQPCSTVRVRHPSPVTRHPSPVRRSPTPVHAGCLPLFRPRGVVYRCGAPAPRAPTRPPLVNEVRAARVVSAPTSSVASSHGARPWRASGGTRRGSSTARRSRADGVPGRTIARDDVARPFSGFAKRAPSCAEHRCGWMGEPVSSPVRAADATALSGSVNSDALRLPSLGTNASGLDDRSIG
jgi:hypothetical protein